jgi:hypothetical protein
MSKGVFYKFIECEYIDIRGQLQTIPDGVWPVFLSSDVTVVANNRSLRLEALVFQNFKINGKAVLVNPQ